MTTKLLGIDAGTRGTRAMLLDDCTPLERENHLVWRYCNRCFATTKDRKNEGVRGLQNFLGPPNGFGFLLRCRSLVVGDFYEQRQDVAESGACGHAKIEVEALVERVKLIIHALRCRVGFVHRVRRANLALRLF